MISLPAAFGCIVSKPRYQAGGMIGIPFLPQEVCIPPSGEKTPQGVDRPEFFLRVIRMRQIAEIAAREESSRVDL